VGFSYLVQSNKDNGFTAKLYENGTLTSGQAAELAGVSKREFIEAIGNYLRSYYD